MNFSNERTEKNRANATRRRVLGSTLLLLGGCRLPASPARRSPEWAGDVAAFPAVRESARVSLRRLPNGMDEERLLVEAERAMDGVVGWLGPERSGEGRVCLFVYRADEPEGVRLRNGRAARGVFFPDGNVMAIAGDPGDERFWDVLRHEAAHRALRRCGIEQLPFWLDEGTATLFETAGACSANPRRRPMARHLAERFGGLRLAPILTKFRPRSRDGAAYAKAWSATLTLYLRHRREFADLARSKATLVPFPDGRLGFPAGKDGVEAFEEETTRLLLAGDGEEK